MHHPTKFQADTRNPWLETQRHPSDLVQAYHGKFQTTVERAKMAILNNDLLHDIVHCPSIFQADIWKPSEIDGNMLQDGGTDGQMDRRLVGRMKRRQNPRRRVKCL